LQQQDRFDAFVHEFNTERPHEALGMKCPAQLYTASPRRYDGLVPPNSVLPTRAGFPASRNFTTSTIISIPAYWSNADQRCVGLTGDRPSGRVTGGGTLPGKAALPILDLPLHVATSGNGATIHLRLMVKDLAFCPAA
jgi:hypothetical protein